MPTGYVASQEVASPTGSSEEDAAARIPGVPLSHWWHGEGRPLVIAGPCSAEGEEQLHESARRLHGARVDYLRAGIWKARTRPNTFEGLGEPALAWLKDAAETAGLKAATEVAHARHVEAALDAGIALLWIGARTTSNPFSVQEIANALRGCQTPVLVKNPTSPDFGLWMGALERLSGAGVRAMGAVLRGVAEVNAAPYRNSPHWQMAIELRRRLPRIPILCDPSHICGRRDMIGDVAQQAMDLGLDGLMIEVHPSPDQAWSDAEQQITPERMAQILSELTVRSVTSPDGSFEEAVSELRARIDGLDSALIGLLGERMDLVRQIAQAKRAMNVTPFQSARWRAVLQDRIDDAGRRGLGEVYTKAIFDVIHRESVLQQSQIVSRVGAPASPAGSPTPTPDEPAEAAPGHTAVDEGPGRRRHA